MSREHIGMILGWIVVMVLAWFLSLACMAYGLGTPWPWDWTYDQRFIHLGIQAGLVLAYGIFIRPRNREE